MREALASALRSNKSYRFRNSLCCCSTRRPAGEGPISSCVCVCLCVCVTFQYIPQSLPCFFRQKAPAIFRTLVPGGFRVWFRVQVLAFAPLTLARALLPTVSAAVSTAIVTGICLSGFASFLTISLPSATRQGVIAHSWLPCPHAAPHLSHSPHPSTISSTARNRLNLHSCSFLI